MADKHNETPQYTYLRDGTQADPRMSFRNAAGSPAGDSAASPVADDRGEITGEEPHQKRMRELRESADKQEQEAKRLKEKRDQEIRQRFQFLCIQDSWWKRHIPFAQHIKADSKNESVTLNSQHLAKPRQTANPEKRKRDLKKLINAAEQNNEQFATITTTNPLIRFHFSLKFFSLPRLKHGKTSINNELVQEANALIQNGEIKAKIQLYEDPKQGDNDMKEAENEMKNHFIQEHGDPEALEKEARDMRVRAEELEALSTSNNTNDQEKRPGQKPEKSSDNSGMHMRRRDPVPATGARAPAP